MVLIDRLSQSVADPRPDADLRVGGPRLRGERPLRVHDHPDRVRHGAEHDEERVALGPNLDAVVGGQRRPDQRAVALEERAPRGRPEGVDEAGRPLDVREQEGDLTRERLGRGHGRRDRCS